MFWSKILYWKLWRQWLRTLWICGELNPLACSCKDCEATMLLIALLNNVVIVKNLMQTITLHFFLEPTILSLGWVPPLVLQNCLSLKMKMKYDICFHFLISSRPYYFFPRRLKGSWFIETLKANSQVIHKIYGTQAVIIFFKFSIKYKENKNSSFICSYSWDEKSVK